MRTLSRMTMPASRFRTLSSSVFAGAFGSCGAGAGGSSASMLRDNSSAYSRSERARKSCCTVWMRSTGLSRSPRYSVSET